MTTTDNKIVEIFIPGPAGRLEAKYYKSKKNTSPIALVLHPHPQYGGTMNNKVVADTFRDKSHLFPIAQNVFPFQQSHLFLELLFCWHVLLMIFCG